MSILIDDSIAFALLQMCRPVLVSGPQTCIILGDLSVELNLTHHSIPAAYPLDITQGPNGSLDDVTY